MKPKIHYISWTERLDVELEELHVEELSDTCLELEIGIAYKPDSHRQACDRFSLLVVTPDTLKGNAHYKGFKQGEYTIILNNFDCNEIRRMIEEKVAACKSEEWEQTLDLLRKHFVWEYENYVE